MSESNIPHLKTATSDVESSQLICSTNQLAGFQC